MMPLCTDDEPLPYPLHALLTEREAAKVLNVSQNTLRNYRSQNKGPVYVKVGGSVRYYYKDLLNFIERGRRKPDSDGPTIGFAAVMFMETETEYVWYPFPEGFAAEDIAEETV